jgi:hypothetical protein
VSDALLGQEGAQDEGGAPDPPFVDGILRPFQGTSNHILLIYYAFFLSSRSGQKVKFVWEE